MKINIGQIIKCANGDRSYIVLGGALCVCHLCASSGARGSLCDANRERLSVWHRVDAELIEFNSLQQDHIVITSGIIEEKGSQPDHKPVRSPVQAETVRLHNQHHNKTMASFDAERPFKTKFIYLFIYLLENEPANAMSAYRIGGQPAKRLDRQREVLQTERVSW